MTSPLVRAFDPPQGQAYERTKVGAPPPAPIARMLPLDPTLPWRSSTDREDLLLREENQRSLVRRETELAARATGKEREERYAGVREAQQELRRLRALIAASQGTLGLRALDAVLGRPQTVRGKEYP